MSEIQKNQRKKNILIVLFLFLLVVFVCIMCWIFIYAKNNPPREFLSPDEIEIKQVQAMDYSISDEPSYDVITTATTFKVTEQDQEFELILTEDKEIKLLKEGIETPIQIMKNDTNINNNIKLIYQTSQYSLILNEAGELYKLNDTIITNNQLNVGQILTNMEVRDIVQISSVTNSVYILNEEDKLINIDNLKEYNGIIDEIKTSTSTIYVYENYGFGLEEGKIFVNENNTIIKINISFDNKIIGENNIIYEINSIDNTLSTSKLGTFEEIGYKKGENDATYQITLISSTGYNDFSSSYYYAR